jgi:serine/threonine protein phosphatase PrpC
MEFNTTVIQATIRGDKEESIPNQDYIEIFENKDLIVTVVSDGLGSSKSSLEGAILACRTVIAEMQDFHHFHEISILGYRIQQNWTNIIGKRAGTAIDYRTTNSFVAVFKNEKKIIVGQLGDDLVSIRMDGLFRYLESTRKDFSNETDCLGSGRNEKYKLALFEFGHSFDFLIATDGVGDELQAEKIEALHEYFKNKYQNINASDRNKVLKNEIEEFLNEKNNDDKSLVFVWSNKI